MSSKFVNIECLFFDIKSDPNQSEPNQSDPNQSKPNLSKPNQCNWNFLKSPGAPWSFFFLFGNLLLLVWSLLRTCTRKIAPWSWRWFEELLELDPLCMHSARLCSGCSVFRSPCILQGCFTFQLLCIPVAWKQYFFEYIKPTIFTFLKS